jgi:hypothetical protein
MGYGLDNWGSRFQFPAGVGNFSLHHRVQTCSGAHPASYLMGTGGSFTGDKAAGREDDNSPLPSAEVKNAWSYTSTPPIRHSTLCKPWSWNNVVISPKNLSIVRIKREVVLKCVIIQEETKSWTFSELYCSLKHTECINVFVTNLDSSLA